MREQPAEGTSLLLWLIPAGGIGVAVFAMLGLLDSEPVWVRTVWGFVAMMAVLMARNYR